MKKQLQCCHKVKRFSLNVFTESYIPAHIDVVLFTVSFFFLLSSDAALLICTISSSPHCKLNWQGTGYEKANIAQCHWYKNCSLIIAESLEKDGVLQRLSLFKARANGLGKILNLELCVLCKPAAKDEDFTLKDATFLIFSPHFHACVFENTALARDSNCLTSAIQALQIHPACCFTYVQVPLPIQ